MAKIKKVRVTKTRFNTYQVNFMNHRGRQRRISAGKDEEYAQRLRLKFQDWLNAGLDPEKEMDRIQEHQETREWTLRQFFPVFMDRHGCQQSENMQASYHNSFKRIDQTSTLLDSRMSDISKGMVIDYRNARLRRDGVTPSTVNKEVNFIKGMLSRAVEWEMLESNKLEGLRQLPENNTREVEITAEQATQLLDALPVPVSDIAAFAIYTGFRKDNILGLTLEQIHLHASGDTAEVDLIIKGRRKERYVLCPQAVEIVKRIAGDRQHGYVFINLQTGTRYRDVHVTFDRAVKKLGLTIRDGRKLCFHDLRHVFATWLHQSGVPLDFVRSLLGHRDRDTTDRYAFLDRQRISSALSVLPEIEGLKMSRQAATGTLNDSIFSENQQDSSNSRIRILPLKRVAS